MITLSKIDHFSERKKKEGKKKGFLLTLEASKDGVVLICIQILTTQSHGTSGTDAGFPLKTARHFIMPHYVDNCQPALDGRALSNRTEMVVSKTIHFLEEIQQHAKFN